MSDPSPADPLIGVVLDERFRVERLLGEGGMGRVYAATELLLRRRCAVKVLLPEFARDKDSVARFLREARAIAQIRHENVVDIYHLGGDAESGVVFFAMELLTGEDLESRVAARATRPFTWQQVCGWMAQVAGAMAAVHDAGVIHRDLKPSNVFLYRRPDGREQVKLLDFGVAKVTDQAALTKTGDAFGTPFYMSPEQILAQPLDPRTDVYSLGAVLYELLAGRVPFDGEPIQVAMQHCNVAPPPLGAPVPLELAALVLRMLAKDRDARPQTMAEIERTLRGLTDSRELSLPRIVLPLSPGSVTLAARGRPRWSRWAMLSAATLVAALAFLSMRAPRPSDPAPTLNLPPETSLPSSAPPPTPSLFEEKLKAPPTVEVRDNGPRSSVRPVEAPKDTSAVMQPEKPRSVAVDPLKAVRRAALVCRQKLRATQGALITIDYAVGSDGAVTRAVPTVDSELGRCLADSVRSATFPPKLRLGLKVDL